MNPIEVLVKKLVLQISESYPLDLDESSNLNASVSHWLQNPAARLPCFPTALKQEAERYLGPLLSDVLSRNGNTAISDLSSGGRIQLSLIQDSIPFPPPLNPEFRFIDLFAGIGGFRIALQSNGGQCVFSSEWDKYAKQTYEANFGEIPYGDITKLPKREIPDHDVLAAGFPCQPFSLAGVSKKNSLGKKHGFDDEIQGTLFFEIVEILRVKRPKAFFLENVKNLISHDGGRTFQVIMDTLENHLQYTVNWAVVDGSKWVPQHRERIFIVGYDSNRIGIRKDEIKIPSAPPDSYDYPLLHTIIESETTGYTIGPGTWRTLERHKKHHERQGNGFGYSVLKPPFRGDQVTRTISARYHKDGAEALVYQENDRPRRLTIEEALQLQGYDHSTFQMPVSKTQAYRQIGNSVVVPAVTACAYEIASVIRANDSY